MGEFACVGYHEETRPDTDRKLRKAIVFELEALPHAASAAEVVKDSEPLSSTVIGKKMTLAELRREASKIRPGASPELRRILVRRRAEAVRRYALFRANGVCEACQHPAPFEGKDGPFLEVHHVHRMVDGGPDHPSAVIALCPNCDRRAHSSKDAGEFNAGLVGWCTPKRQQCLDFPLIGR